MPCAFKRARVVPRSSRSILRVCVRACQATVSLYPVRVTRCVTRVSLARARECGASESAFPDPLPPALSSPLPLCLRTARVTKLFRGAFGITRANSLLRRLPFSPSLLPVLLLLLPCAYGDNSPKLRESAACCLRAQCVLVSTKDGGHDFPRLWYFPDRAEVKLWTRLALVSSFTRCRASLCFALCDHLDLRATSSLPRLTLFCCYRSSSSLTSPLAFFHLSVKPYAIWRLRPGFPTCPSLAHRAEPHLPCTGMAPPISILRCHDH